MSEHENPIQSNERQDALNDSKRVEFYSQGVAAWFNSALEHDKSLLTLSVAGIGVLVSLMQTVIDSLCLLLLYASAILAFMVCLVSVLMIFKRNKKHILDVFNGQTADDPVLSLLDSSASFSFFLAMLLSALLGISSAITTYDEKGKKMANESIKKPTQSVAAYDSVNGLAKLVLSSESFNQMASMKKSLQDMAQLRGQAPAQSQTSQTTTTSQAQSAPMQNKQPGTADK
jgi:hypothetical protein